MDNCYLERLDMAEWIPGASGHYLRALEMDTGDVMAEVSMTAVEFWSLPADAFEVEELEDEKILARIRTEYNELQGD